MRIELNCAVCGENRFSLGEQVSDACRVHCSECGHDIGTLGDLKERIAEEVLRRSSGPAKSAERNDA